MDKGDPKKLRGKISSCAFFMQTCRKEHKKKHPDVQSSLRSAQRGGRPCLLKGKENLKTRQRQTRLVRKEKLKHIPPKEETREEVQGSQYTERPPSAVLF
jgi:hypothetical protein